jgi:hypothetical protein
VGALVVDDEPVAAANFVRFLPKPVKSAELI